MTYVSTGYTEDALLWDQEDGTLYPTDRPAPQDARTFRVHWGVDRLLGLPQGLRADIANRYIDALKPIAAELAKYATKEYIPGIDSGSDSYRIVYSPGHEPHMKALTDICEADSDNWELEYQAQKDLGYDSFYNPVSKEAIEARMRQILTENIRDLIVDGDADYTPAKPGTRYTTIRVDLDTGHLSAHTTGDAPTIGDNVREWQVSPLNSRQANKLMRLAGSEALRVANPNALGVIASQAWELLDATLAAHLIGEDEVTAYMGEHGIKDTPARRQKALRSVIQARFQGW